MYYFKIYCEEKPITDGINIWKNELFVVDKMHVQGRRKALILDAVGETKSKVKVGRPSPSIIMLSLNPKILLLGVMPPVKQRDFKTQKSIIQSKME